MQKLNHYSVYEVIDTFEIERQTTSLTLTQWLAASGQFTPFEAQFIEEARQQAELKWDSWNEEELKMNFISLIFFVAKIQEPKQIDVFYERRLAGEVQNVEISLIVDCLLASPTFSGQPKHPYFFLQEFKRSLGDSHDPEGQMLAAMILAQELNQDEQPLYGCWVQGAIWRFTTLKGRQYAVSKSFDATDPDDLHRIVFALRKLRELILSRKS